LIKKISEKDKKDWEKFVKGNEKIESKDTEYLNKKKQFIEKIIDLHGYTLEEANKKIFEYIENCYLNNVDKINIITGKGLRSKNLDDPHQSNDLSILKYSVPNFIKNNTELMNKILKIDFDSVNSHSKGNFDIILKKVNKKENI
jgi:DNA-nicking Smr family endonuclease|tara:strand:- start:745 stop:1176 length:432 start_codon:yes stop_codon:yes gene_type:complete